MKAIRLVKGVLSLAVVATVGIGVWTATEGRASAVVKNLCGVSILWRCTLPNGTTTTFGGTVCDVKKYEQQTGATCVPSGQ